MQPPPNELTLFRAHTAYVESWVSLKATMDSDPGANWSQAQLDDLRGALETYTAAAALYFQLQDRAVGLTQSARQVA